MNENVRGRGAETGDQSELSSLYQMPLDKPHGLDFDKINISPTFANDFEVI